MTKTAHLSVLGVLGGVAFVAFLGACLFVSAGRWELPWFWAYLGVWTAATAAGTFLIDPTLVQERIWPGPGGKDYGTVAAASPLMLGQSVVAGLDVGPLGSFPPSRVTPKTRPSSSSKASTSQQAGSINC
jgi:hypothetical protein